MFLPYCVFCKHQCSFPTLRNPETEVLTFVDEEPRGKVTVTRPRFYSQLRARSELGPLVWAFIQSAPASFHCSILEEVTLGILKLVHLVCSLKI